MEQNGTVKLIKKKVFGAIYAWQQKEWHFIVTYLTIFLPENYILFCQLCILADRPICRWHVNFFRRLSSCLKWWHHTISVILTKNICRWKWAIFCKVISKTSTEPFCCQRHNCVKCSHWEVLKKLSIFLLSMVPLASAIEF